MKTSKERKSKLMAYANEVIADTFRSGRIEDSFNGQMAAFSVSVALSGLKPTLAIYHGDSAAIVNKDKIVEMLAKMYAKDKNGKYSNTEDFYKMVCGINDEKQLRQDITEYAIALKLTLRTFQLV